jgi:biopolymer transport protein ExbD
MTVKQIRAVTRRLKEENDEAEEEIGEINLVPYMDIVTNIIIFLLASTVQQLTFGNINASSPTISQGGGASADDPPDKPPLNLTITVSATGFIIAASGGVMPSIPRLGPKWDFKALTTELMKIKKEFPEETKATFNADSGIAYETVVQTLDAMREDDKGKMMFPDVIFAAGIL